MCKRNGKFGVPKMRLLTMRKVSESSGLNELRAY